MWKQLADFAKRIAFLTQDTQKNKADIKVTKNFCCGWQIPCFVQSEEILPGKVTLDFCWKRMMRRWRNSNDGKPDPITRQLIAAYRELTQTTGVPAL